MVGAGEGYGPLSVAVAPVSSNDTAGNMWNFRTYFYSTVLTDHTKPGCYGTSYQMHTFLDTHRPRILHLYITI